MCSKNINPLSKVNVPLRRHPLSSAEIRRVELVRQQIRRDRTAREAFTALEGYGEKR